MGEHPPDFLTIEEARAVLNIGRTMAYREAALFVASGGELGAVPAIELKPRVLRVPRFALEELLGGPLRWPPPSLKADDWLLALTGVDHRPSLMIEGPTKHDVAVGQHVRNLVR